MVEKILIYFHHGLGDCTQFTVVLRHVSRHRPDWLLDLWTGWGRHSCFHDLCHRVWHDREAVQPHPNDYDRVLVPNFREHDGPYRTDSPSTKAVRCLEEDFQIDWEASLGRYWVDFNGEPLKLASDDLNVLGWPSRKPVLIHHRGVSCHEKKDLAVWQTQELCRHVLSKRGMYPVLLDWSGASPLADEPGVVLPAQKSTEGDAAQVAALISLSAAFVGIDSGPGKLASATDTPSLICWVKNNPAEFHDPADNTVHLVPADMTPPDYFLRNYRWSQYDGTVTGLVASAKRWLDRMLG